jgi:hypothetical protein
VDLIGNGPAPDGPGTVAAAGPAIAAVWIDAEWTVVTIAAPTAAAAG